MKNNADEFGKIRDYFNKDSMNKSIFYLKEDRTKISKHINKREMWKIYIQTLEFILMDSDNDPVVLDAGCGIGNFLFELNKRKSISKIIGVDFLREPLNVARKRPDFFDKVSFFECDLQNLCFKDQSIDFVFCLNVVHHIPQNKIKQFILELSRVSKKIVVLEIRNEDFMFNFFYDNVLIPQFYENLPIHSTQISWVEALMEDLGFFLKFKIGKTILDCLCRRIILVFEREKRINEII
jgi:ubiquinone/menaquinone biosynthesis C-methylase UbiE